jgi:hypothetical protein
VVTIVEDNRDRQFERKEMVEKKPSNRRVGE